MNITLCSRGSHLGDECKCSSCGNVRDEGHDWSKNCDLCDKCGKTRSGEHVWDGCKCTRCATVRDEGHDWSKDCEACAKCGRDNSREHDWSKDYYACCKCAKTRPYQSQRRSSGIGSLEELFDSCEKGSLVGVRRSLASKVDVNVRNSYGWFPLDCAIKKGRKEIVELLINNGANINYWMPIDAIKCLESSNSNNSLNFVEILKLLIINGADVNVIDKGHFNENPLLLNAIDMSNKRNIYDDLVQFIIEKGADVNATAKNGNTALHAAVGRGRKKIVEMLIAAGANVNAKNDLGSTPLTYACCKDEWKGTVELLINAGADMGVVQFGWVTPASIAVEYNCYEIAKLLLARGADTDVTFKADATQESRNAVLNSYIDMSWDELVTHQLVFLSREGYLWGFINKFPTLFENYPQYNQIRRIGEIIYERWGNSVMQEACYLLMKKVKVREGGGQYLVEYIWEGIGGWCPNSWNKRAILSFSN
jgi:ankyrin repeat protein